MASTAHYNIQYRAGAISGGPKGVAVLEYHGDGEGGFYRIYGTIRVGGSPAARRVRLFHRLTGRLLRETVSGTNGAYEFNGLKYQEYFVVADDDPQATFNAAIADRVLPE